MKVYIQGKKKVVTLSDTKDYITQGGEGTIYIKQGTVYKVYHDRKKMIPEAKMQELQNLDRPNIIKPDNILLDSKNNHIGFTMREVPRSVPLCKLFVTNYWAKKGITMDIVAHLLEQMKDTISFIHGNACLIVDGNEFNYITDDVFGVPYFIDVDSYQTPLHRAPSLHPNIKDWHTKGFSEQTDWFAFAIVSFQLITGIHPFKGKHPDFTKHDLEGRMKANLSILGPKVSYPPAVRSPENTIPQGYMHWYHETFEEGGRSKPPNCSWSIGPIIVKQQVIGSGDHFDITRIARFDKDIIYYRLDAHNEVVKFKNGSTIINQKEITQDIHQEVILTERSKTPILVSIKGKKLDIVGGLNLDAQDMMVVDDYLFIKNLNRLVGIRFTEMQSGEIVPAIDIDTYIMPKATELFSGVVYQNVLGKPYFKLLVKDGNSMRLYEFSILELEGHKILDARYENQVLVLTTHKKTYHRVIIRRELYKDKYDIRFIDDIDYTPINFVTLDSGVVIMIHDDDSIELFTNTPNNSKSKLFTKSGLNSSMRLCRDRNDVMVISGNEVYKIKMK
ncbi:hypothetical protein LCGC14_1649010 [marine sediment metagenome]|uniref:Protein kinase domain-containing protein n=1 Tax=marine sediment metagenome TaxID=412755 RepID=A0A0F9HXD4_9ZZZZ